MNRALPVALALAVMGGQALPEQIAVRSGEHAAFSRLVLEPQAATGWTLGRIGRGYELRLDRPGVTFDLSQVFDLIPQTRIAAVTAGSTEGSVALGLSCDCSVTAFETAAGVIVVDVADAAPDPASPFEARLDATGTVPVTASDPQNAAPAARTRETPDPAGASAVPDSLVLLRRAADAPPRIPYLDAFWTDPPTDAAGGGGPTTPTGQGALAMSEAPVAPLPPALESNDRTATPTRDQADLPATVMSPPQTVQETDVSDAHPDATEDHAIAPQQAPDGSAPSGAAGRALLPDPRVLIAERDLLVQLSRAASQGLIVASRSGKGPPDGVADSKPYAPDAASQTGAGPTGAEASMPKFAPADHLAVRAETSIDRVIIGGGPAPQMTSAGRQCPPPDAVDVASWGKPEAAAAQIADLRRPLVGEFDQPDGAAAAALARLYLYLGFGAEAAATLDALGVADGDAPYLRDLAAIMDDAPVKPDGPLADMTDCETHAALWSVLSHRSLSGSDPVAYGAVVQGFSALPIHLRQHLGPRLARLFIAQGKPDVARSIRNAIARADVDHGETLKVIDADLELSRGNRAAAETLLDGVVARGSLDAPAALRDAIRSRLDDRRPVDGRMAEAAIAYGFELGTTPLGRELQTLAVLALASDGRFSEAFDELARLGAPSEAEARPGTRDALVGMLIDSSDDPAFLDILFRHRATFAAGAEDPGIRVRAARRMLAAGLPAEAERLLAALSPQDDEARLLRARAALADDRAADVPGLLDGMEDDESLSLRAEAEARRGRHRVASALYGALGDSARSGREAWRAGDLAGAAETGSDPVRAALQILGTDMPASPGTASVSAGAAADIPASAARQMRPVLPEDAPLSGARAMVEDSKQARQAITDLLAALAAPDERTPGSPDARQAGPGPAAEPTQ